MYLDFSNHIITSDTEIAQHGHHKVGERFRQSCLAYVPPETINIVLHNQSLNVKMANVTVAAVSAIPDRFKMAFYILYCCKIVGVLQQSVTVTLLSGSTVLNLDSQQQCM